MTREELIKNTNDYIYCLPKVKFTPEEIKFCNEIQKQRIQYSNIWNATHGFKKGEIKKTKISRWHDDQELSWGLLCELMICREYGTDEIKRNWAKDQIRQNEQLLKEGHFDCRDIGKTQVRAAEYSETEPRRLIYRQNDFFTKSTQPVIACVINTAPGDLWAVTCGFFSWEDLKNRKQEFWDDPDRRGFPAMFIPYWELTPMAKFNRTWLLE